MSVNFGKNTDKVIKIIKECINLTSTNIVEFERRLYILGRLINISSFPSNSATKRNIIRKSIGIIKVSGKVVPSFVLKILSIEEKNALGTKHIKFIIAFQFIIKEGHFTRKQITIDGVKFKVANKYNFFSKFENPKNAMLGDHDVIESLKKDYLILYTNYSAPDFEMAFEELYSKFEVMRGLLNLCLKFQRHTLLHIGRPRPEGIIRQPKFFLIYSQKKKLKTYKYTLEPFIDPPSTLDIDRLNSFYKVIRHYSNIKDSPIKRVFEDALKLYVSSLDLTEKKSTFLYLWQVLEILTLKDVKFKTGKKVRQRVKSIFRYDSLSSEIIDALCDNRNKIAHGSVDVSIDIIDIQLLREIVEGLIFFVFNHLNVIDNKSKFDYFYDNFSLNITQLEEKNEIIKYIKKLKNTQ